MSKQRSIGGIYASLTLRDKGFAEGIKRAKLSLKEIQDGQRGGLVNRDRQGSSSPTDFKSAIAGSGALAAGATAATAAFVGLNSAMTGVLETYAEYDSLVRGLKVLDGTASATAARLEELRKIAKAPGLGFEQAVQGDIRLRSTGLTANESAAAIKGFGNALAAVGGTKDDLKGVFLAIGQISAKGKVSAEEINQLAERLPQIRQLMKEAFGTASTEEIQKMGIESKQFITGIIAELEKLPKATGGAQNDLDNYNDAWRALKTQAAESATYIAGPWVKSLTGAFAQARRDLNSLKSFFGGKTNGLQGPAGKTEAEQIAEKEAETKKQLEIDAVFAANKVHNANLAFYQELEEERTAYLKEEAEKRLAIEEETNRTRSAALAKYNEESGIVSAKLRGDDDKLKSLEREKAIREKIAELVQAGFKESEARVPAEAMIDALIKVDQKKNETGPITPDVNSYQSMGLSLGGDTLTRKQDTTNTLLKDIKTVLQDANRAGTLKF